MAKSKSLTVCRKGRVRSVALAKILQEHGHDAFAVGFEQHLKALQLGLQWADNVFVIDYPTKMIETIRKSRPDAIIVPTGPDVWLNPSHPELVKLLEDWWDSHG